MDITRLIVEVISGAVGGNRRRGHEGKESWAGREFDCGIIRRGIGGTILQMVMGSAASGGGEWICKVSWPVSAAVA